MSATLPAVFYGEWGSSWVLAVFYSECGSWLTCLSRMSAHSLFCECHTLSFENICRSLLLFTLIWLLFENACECGQTLSKEQSAQTSQPTKDCGQTFSKDKWAERRELRQGSWEKFADLFNFSQLICELNFSQLIRCLAQARQRILFWEWNTVSFSWLLFRVLFRECLQLWSILKRQLADLSQLPSLSSFVFRECLPTVFCTSVVCMSVLYTWVLYMSFLYISVFYMSVFYIHVCSSTYESVEDFYIWVCRSLLVFYMSVFYIHVCRRLLHMSL